MWQVNYCSRRWQAIKPIKKAPPVREALQIVEKPKAAEKGSDARRTG
jgi:hypothetical protein